MARYQEEDRWHDIKKQTVCIHKIIISATQKHN